MYQAAGHREILTHFTADMEQLAACELHPAARAPGARRLLDLLPEQRLRDWADSCARSHAAFMEKVGALGICREGVSLVFDGETCAHVPMLPSWTR